MPTPQRQPRPTSGREYKFAFMKLDIVGHSRILRKGPADEAVLTFNSFEEWVEEHVTRHKGTIWSWQGDGGLCVFWSDPPNDIARNAYRAARDILRGLNTFNDENSLPDEHDRIRLRIALHQGDARYQKNLGRIHSNAINFVAHLESQRTYPNSISLSDAIWTQLPIKWRTSLYKMNETFEGLEVYTTMPSDRWSEFDESETTLRVFSISEQTLAQWVERYKGWYWGYRVGWSHKLKGGWIKFLLQVYFVDGEDVIRTTMFHRAGHELQEFNGFLFGARDNVYLIFEEFKTGRFVTIVIRDINPKELSVNGIFVGTTTDKKAAVSSMAMEHITTTPTQAEVEIYKSDVIYLCDEQLTEPSFAKYCRPPNEHERDIIYNRLGKIREDGNVLIYVEAV